jgi:hypothetical protein
MDILFDSDPRNIQDQLGRDEVVCSNNVLLKFIFFFRMPFLRKALFLYVLSNKRSFKKNTNFERNSNEKKNLINVRKFLFE